MANDTGWFGIDIFVINHAKGRWLMILIQNLILVLSYWYKYYQVNDIQ